MQSFPMLFVKLEGIVLMGPIWRILQSSNCGKLTFGYKRWETATAVSVKTKGQWPSGRAPKFVCVFCVLHVSVT